MCEDKFKYKIWDNVICRNTGYFTSNASVKGKIIGTQSKKAIFWKKINKYFIYTEDFNKDNYSVNSLILEVEEQDVFLNNTP